MPSKRSQTARGRHRTQLRTALLAQLAYLIDEVEALKDVVGRVPEPVRVARPPGAAFSLKEIYGLFVMLDEAVYLPRLRQMIAEDEPALDAVDEEALVRQAGWNAQPLAHILTRLQEARRALVTFLRLLPPDDWARVGLFDGECRDVYGFAHHITQRDADLLRTIGYRLHESRLTDRPGGLPR